MQAEPGQPFGTIAGIALAAFVIAMALCGSGLPEARPRWMDAPLDFAARIEANETIVRNRPGTAEAREAAARIAEIHREAKKTFDAMKASARRLEREGRREDAMRVLRRAANEFTTPERIDRYLEDCGRLELTLNPKSPFCDPKAAAAMAAALVEKYARTTGVPVTGNPKKDAASIRTFALEAHALDARVELQRISLGLP